MPRRGSPRSTSRSLTNATDAAVRAPWPTSLPACQAPRSSNSGGTNQAASRQRIGPVPGCERSAALGNDHPSPLTYALTWPNSGYTSCRPAGQAESRASLNRSRPRQLIVREHHGEGRRRPRLGTRLAPRTAPGRTPATLIDRPSPLGPAGLHAGRPVTPISTFIYTKRGHRLSRRKRLLTWADGRTGLHVWL